MTECCCEAFTAVTTIGVFTASSGVPDIQKAGVSLPDLETGVDKNAVLRDDVANNVHASVTERNILVLSHLIELERTTLMWSSFGSLMFSLPTVAARIMTDVIGRGSPVNFAGMNASVESCVGLVFGTLVQVSLAYPTSYFCPLLGSRGISFNRLTFLKWYCAWQFHKDALRSLWARDVTIEVFVSFGTMCLYIYAVGAVVWGLFHSDFNVVAFFDVPTLFITIMLIAKFLDTTLDYSQPLLLKCGCMPPLICAVPFQE